MTGQTLLHLGNTVISWVSFRQNGETDPPITHKQTPRTDRTLCRAGLQSGFAAQALKSPCGRKTQDCDPPKPKPGSSKAALSRLAKSLRHRGVQLNSLSRIRGGWQPVQWWKAPCAPTRLVPAAPAPQPAPPSPALSNRHCPAAPAAKTPAKSGFACLPPNRMSRLGRTVLTEPAIAASEGEIAADGFEEGGVQGALQKRVRAPRPPQPAVPRAPRVYGCAPHERKPVDSGAA